MKYLVAAQSVCGKIRGKNEDNLCIDGEYLPLNHRDCELISKKLSYTSSHLVGVFDGMGGYSDGETASYLAASTVCEYMRMLELQKDKAKILTEFCLDANDKICDVADGSHMGTTCALLCLKDSDFFACNIGDSPIFLVRNGNIQKLSVDHNQKRSYEKITGKKAHSNQKFKLTQYMGIPKTDMLIEPFITSGKVYPADVFLLCSDGLTDMLSIHEINNILDSNNLVSQIVEELIKQALVAGGRDNITVICVKIEKRGIHLRNLMQRFLKICSHKSGDI